MFMNGVLYQPKSVAVCCAQLLPQSKEEEPITRRHREGLVGAIEHLYNERSCCQEGHL